MDNKQITVTSQLLSILYEFYELLKEIRDPKWITNIGSFHRQLEDALAEYGGICGVWPWSGADWVVWKNFNVIVL